MGRGAPATRSDSCPGYGAGRSAASPTAPYDAFTSTARPMDRDRMPKDLPDEQVVAILDTVAASEALDAAEEGLGG